MLVLLVSSSSNSWVSFLLEMPSAVIVVALAAILGTYLLDLAQLEAAVAVVEARVATDSRFDLPLFSILRAVSDLVMTRLLKTDVLGRSVVSNMQRLY